MKRWKIVLCAVLAIVAALTAGLYLWQRENLKALKDAVSYSSGEIEEKLAENQQAVSEAVNAAPEVTVRDLTDEERQALRDGSMTHEEVAERLVEKPPVQETPAPAENVPETPPVDVPEVLPPVDEAYQKELSALIAKVYVLREEYTIALEEMYDSAKADYLAMPESKRTKANLAKMTADYLGKATALEKECDDKMIAVTESMQTLIKAHQGDMSLVDTVLAAYTNEKSLKKSWYMSKLEEKGLI